MTTAFDLLTAALWWLLLAGFAGVAVVLVAAVFFHAFPNGKD